MTINNLYYKISHPDMWQIVSTTKLVEGQEHQPPFWKKDFDYPENDKKTIDNQLDAILKFSESFKRLSKQIGIRKEMLMQEQR